MSHQYGFEKLEVWQSARILTKEIYTLTMNFPESEKFNLVSQLRRCAVGIVSNIAEGSARRTAKDQAHFTNIAYGSLMELLNQLIIASDLGYLSEEKLEEIKTTIFPLTVKVNNLHQSQLKRI